MQDFSRFLIEKIIRLVPLKVKRIFAIEAGNLLDFGEIIFYAIGTLRSNFLLHKKEEQSLSSPNNFQNYYE